ncbi:MAG: T9SS type A sorting domain-containing protein [Bacteroidia bacterium]
MQKLKLFATFAFLLTYSLKNFIQAQSIASYVFSTNTNASLNRSFGSLIDDINMASGTTILIGGSQASQSSSTVPIGFDFWSNGQRFTTFMVTSNGWVSFGINSSPAITWLTNMGSGVRLAPFLGPLTSTSPVIATIGTSAIGRVHYKTIGAAPSRICVIEFLRMAINTTVVDDTNTFQVRIYEQTGAIEYVYGRMKVTDGAPINYNIGIQFPTTAFQSVNTSNNTSSTTVNTTNSVSLNNTFITNLHGVTPGNQRMYRWQAPQPSTPTNLTFSNITNSSITLNWTDVIDELGYSVYASTDGGITYNWVTNTSTNITSAVVTNLPANTLIHFKVHARREVLGEALDGSTTTLAGSVISSIKDGNWNDPTVWNTNTVPTSFDSVLVSTGDTVIINALNLNALNLVVNGTVLFGTSSSSLSIQGNLVINNTGIFSAGTGNSTHNLSLGGSTTSNISANLINNGIFDLFTTASVNTTFFGTLNAVINGNGTFEFANITIQKGNNSNPVLNGILEILTPNITVAPPTTSNRLIISSGTLKISSPCNITPYPGDISVSINSSSGRLWLNHPNAVISTSSNSSTNALQATVAGHLLIDNGILNIGNGNHNIQTASTTRIELNNGTFNIFGGLTLTNNSTCSLIINGGNLNIDPQVGTIRRTTTALDVTGNSTFLMTGGNITFIDPIFNSNVATIGINLNVNKSITGGNIIIGNGTSTDVSSTPLQTTGFGINSVVPFFNLIVNNRVDISNTRQLRLINDLQVLNNLTIQPNGYLFIGTGATGGKLTVNGNITNNGTIAGTWITGTLNTGNLELVNNNTTINLSGNGSLLNLNQLSINNPNGIVNFSNTNPWVVQRVNLLSGLANLGNNFTIGTNSLQPFIQIGGVDESTNAGSFFTIPTLNTNAGLPIYIYGASNGTPTTGSANEMPSGTLNASRLIIDDENGLNANRNIVLRDSLILRNGNLNLGSNNLTLGQSATIPGWLVSNNNFINVTSGIITRWYANNQTILNNVDNGFPIAVNGLNRSVLINSNSTPINIGGSFSVSHSDASIFIDLNTPFVDDLVNVNRRTLTSWTLNQTGIVASGGLRISLTGQGVGTVNNVSNLRMVRANDASAGTNVNGSGTNSIPIVTRSFTSSNLAQINNTFFIGANSSENPLAPVFIAIANGNWNNPFIWNTSQVPTQSNGVIIPNGITVTHTGTTPITCDTLYLGGTLNFNADTFNITKGIECAGNLNIQAGVILINGSTQNGITIGDGGSISQSAGNIRLGDMGGSNRTLTVNGTLNLSGGNFEVNGNVLFNSSATFNQSGGNLIIDGNSGTASTSVPQAVHHLSINTSNLNCNAGNIILIDPPHSSYSSNSTQSVRINAFSTLTAFTGSHTMVFGNGTSNTQGNANGFNVDNRRNGIVPFQNVIINSGSANGRWVSPSYSSGTFGMYIKGNLTIEANSELRHTTPSQLVIGGNLVNNGILTAGQAITFGGLGYVINNAQNISGTGIFRNNVTSPTANITTATLDNQGGLTIANAAATISFSNALNLTNGVLNAGNNTIKINQGATLNRTNGHIIGTINRFVNTGNNVNIVFPIGVGSTYTPFTVTLPSVTTAGELILNNIGIDHPQIGSSCFDANKTVNRIWVLFGLGLVGLNNYTAQINYANSDIDVGANPSNFLVKYYNSSIWLDPTSTLLGTNSATVTGINGAAEFQIGEFSSINASVSISASSANICIGTGVTFTATPTNGGSSPVYQWRKNGNNVGSNSPTYFDNSLNNGDIITCSMISSLPCAGSAVNSNSIVMQVSSPTIAGIVGANQNICTGNIPSQLTLTGFTGSIIRWESATVPFTSWSVINNTNSTYQPGSLTQTTAFRAIVQNGGCLARASDSARITVNAAPVGGIVSGSSTICSGNSAPALTLSGHSGGSIIRWESSISPFFVWTPISNTTTTLNPGPVTQTTRYRAVISNGVCNEVVSSEGVVSVQQPGTWLGLVSSDWTNPSNWCGGVPSALTNVTINVGTPFQPVVNGNVSCRDITMFNNTSLSFSGTNNTLSINGDAFISTQANVNTTNGTIAFTGSSYQLIPVLNYNNLTINGSGFKEIAGNIIVNGQLTLNNGIIQLNNSNITITASGNVNGGSVSSFIVTNGFGRLVQNNIGSGGRTGLIFYPVGPDVNSFNPIFITNAGTADNYSVGIIDGVYNSYSGQTPNSMSVINNVVDKTYIIDEANAGGSNLNVIFQWNGVNELSGFNRSNCYVARYSAGWNPFTFTSASGTNPYTVLLSGLTTTGIFGIGSNGALPVSWLSFNGIRNQNGVLLKWQTASEKNASHFEIERSYNGSDFETIGIIKANGNSQTVKTYTYNDNTISLLEPTAYYRLKQFDKDGSFEYSNTISVSGDDVNTEVKVYPNPFSDELTVLINNSSNELLNITITDLSGKLIKNEISKSNNGIVLLNDLTDLPKGAYILIIEAAGFKNTQKLIKQ